MTKKECIAELNKELRYALRTYHAESGLSQEELAEMMQITPRACSGLENGEYGFSVYSMIALFSIRPSQTREFSQTESCAKYEIQCPSGGVLRQGVDETPLFIQSEEPDFILFHLGQDDSLCRVSNQYFIYDGLFAGHVKNGVCFSNR